MNNTKIYILSPTNLFIIIGLMLLLGVIMWHDAINQNSNKSGLIHTNIKRAGVETASAADMPLRAVNEVINSSANIGGRVDNCAERPTEVARLICESYYKQKNSTNTFIVQD